MSIQPGDLFACRGRDRVSRLISWGTARLLAPAGLRVGPCHVAIAARHGRHGMLWVESTAFGSALQQGEGCVIRKRVADGCQAHTLANRIDYWRAVGSVEVYRLAPIESLSTEESGLLSEILFKHFVEPGIRYDWPHVVLAGTRVLKRTDLMPAETRDALFCSELVAAVLMRLGRLARGNPTRYSPADLLRELVRNGTYHRVPLPELPLDESTDRAAGARVYNEDQAA